MATRRAAAAPTMDVERLLDKVLLRANDTIAVTTDALRGTREEVRLLHETARTALEGQRAAYELLEAERLKNAQLRGELEREKTRDKGAQAELVKLQMIDAYVRQFGPDVILGAREIVHALKGDNSGRVREALGKWIVALPEDVRRAAYAAAPAEYRALAEAMGSQQGRSTKGESS